MDKNKAKNLYKKYHCSMFGIAREESCYDEFRLEYGQKIRDQWAKSFLSEYIPEFEKNPTRDNYFPIYMILRNHHDLENVQLFTDMLRKVQIDGSLKYGICRDILGMANLNDFIAVLDFARECKDKKDFEYLLSYVHGFLDDTGAVDTNLMSDIADMREVTAEYDKIQAREKNEI